jgi:HK97 gp10 family phage protein
MAVSNLSFSAQVEALVKKTERNMEAVFREASRRVITEAQTNVPVDTGFLRSSLQVGVNVPVPPASRPQTTPGAVPSISAVIAGASLGDTITAGYTANYALYVEYGARGRPPVRFVGRAVSQWQSIVNRVVAEVNARGR